MRKRILQLTAASIVLLLGACTNSQPTTEGQSAPTATQTAPAADQPSARQATPQSHIPVQGPTVVDFYADWCGPCKQLSPVLEQLENKYAGQVTFLRVNVDQEADLARAFGIQSIPTLLFLSPDGIVDTSIGLVPMSELEAKIKSLL